MRIFRDSVTPSAIPLGGIQGVMGYANGHFRWTDQETRRFTAAGLQVVHIDVNGAAPGLAAIVDVERFDVSPAQAPDWIRERNAFRGDAAVYCGLDNCPALFAATSQVFGHYWLIVADWDNSPEAPAIRLPANVKLLGKQYKNTPDYDETAIYADNWHRRPS